ncbi:MAG: tetratricopeptide repeat protein [Pseudomonadota bacterium]|nr:tetratricopeptide repeat protein [Pseudomonadota bacterium]
MARLDEAQQCLAAGRYSAAEALLNSAISEPDVRAEGHYLLGISALMQGQGEVAVRLARTAVIDRPDEPRYQFALGRALKAVNDLDAAENAYRRAIELQPGFADPHVSLGIVLKAKGHLDEAIACYEQALRLNPGLAVAHSNLAAARGLRAARNSSSLTNDIPTEEVIEGMRLAVSLDPKDPELHRNFGTLLERVGRHDDAARAFNQALTIRPSDAAACVALGKCLMALGGFELAREMFEKWLALNGRDADVMRVLAGVLLRMGEADSALQWTDRALALAPNPLTAMEAGSALIQLRRLDEGLRRCRQALDDSGRNPALYPVLLLGLNYLHEDPATILAAHAEFGALVPRPTARPPRRIRAPGERLRVGYVSGDFLRHSVSFFISPLLEHHDKSRFEVVCYHNNARSDHVTERLKSCGHRFVECAHLTDEGLAKRIADDGIDILIDLAGPTAQSRILMFAMAPAPLQIAYLGYPTVTGVPGIDFRVTDGVIDPGDMPESASEVPLRLPHTMFCYRPDDAPALALPPSQRNGFITFGSFNNAAKISDHTLDLWAAAMHAVAGSRLLLKAATLAQASIRLDIERALAERGIAAERLSMHARAADDQGHLALYNEIDIGLDTYPYNGATTTCEALWMGVPVISRRGRTHTSRMGASLLGAIDRNDCVADSDAEFAARAATLASGVDALASWRAAARDALRASPLMGHAAFTREFEALLDRAWDTPVAHHA